MTTLGRIEFDLGLQSLQANKNETAVSHFKLASSHHHAGATFNLGLCYELGQGVKKDLFNAMQCYRTAAAMGHEKAMYNLGVFYSKGLGGLKKDRRAARACLKAAQEMGLKMAEIDASKSNLDKMRKKDEEVSMKYNKIHMDDVIDKQAIASN